MTGNAWTYLFFTGALCIALGGLIAYYYGRGRRNRVEDPKYRMLEDESGPARPEKGRDGDG